MGSAHSALFAPSDGRLTAIIAAYLLSPEEAFVYAKELPENRILHSLSTSVTLQQSVEGLARIGWADGLKILLTEPDVSASMILNYGAKWGSLDTIAFAITGLGNHEMCMATYEAVAWGQVEAMKYIYGAIGTGDFFPNAAFHSAATGGHVAAMRLAKA